MRLLGRVRDWLRHDDGTYSPKGSLVEPKNLATEVLIGGAIMAIGGVAWGVWRLAAWLFA